MSMMDLIRKKKAASKPKALAPQPEASEKTATANDTPEPVAQSSSALDRAKQAFLEGKNAFDLADYDLPHMDKRAFVLWRKKQLEEATQAQRDNDIPPVNPPDAATDDEPVDLEDQKVADYDFEEVDGVGAKTAENIREFIAEKGIVDLVEMLDMNLRKIGGIGKKSEAALKETIKRERNWTPDDHDPEQEETRADQGDDVQDLTEQEDIVLKAKWAHKQGNTRGLEEIAARMESEDRQEFYAWRAEFDAKQEEDPKSEDQESGGDRASGAEPEALAEPQKRDATPSILYIDCYPTKGSRPADLGDLIAPHKARLAEEDDVSYWNANGYGKARKWLTCAILDDPRFLVNEQAVFARSTDQGMDHLLPEIRQFFDLVVEG